MTSLDPLCAQLDRYAQDTLQKTDFHVDPDGNLVDQLDLDSIKVLNLIMDVEDEFDVSIPINRLVDVQTVRQLAQMIDQLKA
ncbi:MAG: acyl carrier protein [Methylococcales bacterium]|nr:acyl carrier protein [Methylococcales bacterium]